MCNRIISLAEVKIQKNEREERREYITERILPELLELDFNKCLINEGLELLKNGNIIWQNASYDCFYSVDNCTDIYWLIEMEETIAAYYTILKLSTNPHKDDLVFGFSHMFFERYDIEVPL